MKAARAALLSLAVLAVVAVAGAWFLPGLLDWNRYRPEIERLATAALGRPVHLGGAITLELLPHPVLTAADLRVEDVGDGVTLTARELRLRTALGRLLAGRLTARSVALQSPVLRLPWPVPSSALQIRPTWLRSAHADIKDGTLQMGGVQLTGIDAQFATDPITGTLSGRGSAALSGAEWRFTVRLAQPGGDGAAGLDATLDGQGALQDTGGHFSGTVAGDGALTGKVSGRGRDLSLLVPAPAVLWQASGTLTAFEGVMIADDLSLQLASSPAHGVVALRVGEGARLDLALDAGRLDLDGWLPVLTRAPANKLPVTIDLFADAATLAGGTLRHVRGGFDLADGVIAVRDVSAVLPGDAAVALAGRTGPGPGFRGTGRLSAPDLRATLAWAGLSVHGLGDVLPATAGQTARLAGTVSVSNGQVSFTDVDGTLDRAHVGGKASLTLGERPAVSINADAVGLALDRWLPPPGSLVRAYPWPDLSRRFAGFDADVTLRATSAEWAGVPLDRVDLEARFSRPAVQVRRLVLSGMTSHVQASGTLGEGGRLADGALEVSTIDAAALRDLAPELGLRRLALLHGPAELHLRAAGPPDAIDVRADAVLADCRIEARPRVNLPARSWAGTVSLHHPGAPRLLALLGLPDAGEWLGDGSLSLVAEVSATPGGIDARQASLTAGALRLEGSFSVQPTESRTRVAGRIDAETLPLPYPRLRSTEPLPLGALRGLDVNVALRARRVLIGRRPALRDAQASLALQDRTVRLEGLRAVLDDGTLEGNATFEGAAEVPHLALSGRVTGAQIGRPLFGTPLDVRGGQATADARLEAEGYSPAALLSTLSGEVSASVRNGTAVGFDLAGASEAVASDDAGRRDALARAALGGGATSFSTLDLVAGVRNGTATLAVARLDGPSGTATASGTLDIPDDRLDLRVVLRPIEPPGAPDLAVTFDGPAADPQRTVNVFDLLRWSLAQPAQ